MLGRISVLFVILVPCIAAHVVASGGLFLVPVSPVLACQTGVLGVVAVPICPSIANFWSHGDAADRGADAAFKACFASLISLSKLLISSLYAAWEASRLAHTCLSEEVASTRFTK